MNLNALQIGGAAGANRSLLAMLLGSCAKGKGGGFTALLNQGQDAVPGESPDPDAVEGKAAGEKSEEDGTPVVKKKDGQKDLQDTTAGQLLTALVASVFPTADVSMPEPGAADLGGAQQEIEQSGKTALPEGSKSTLALGTELIKENVGADKGLNGAVGDPLLHESGEKKEVRSQSKNDVHVVGGKEPVREAGSASVEKGKTSVSVVAKENVSPKSSGEVATADPVEKDVTPEVTRNVISNQPEAKRAKHKAEQEVVASPDGSPKTKPQDAKPEMPDAAEPTGKADEDNKVSPGAVAKVATEMSLKSESHSQITNHSSASSQIDASAALARSVVAGASGAKAEPVSGGGAAHELPAPKAIAAEPVASPMALLTGKLTERLAGPQLEFSWRSHEAGEIQVNTSLYNSREVQVAITTEHNDLAGAMRSELTSLDNGLRDHSLRLGDVNIVAGSRSALSLGSSMTGQQQSSPDWHRTPMPYVPAEERNRSESESGIAVARTEVGSAHLSVLA